jgi:hypothetical protein
MNNFGGQMVAGEDSPDSLHRTPAPGLGIRLIASINEITLNAGTGQFRAPQVTSCILGQRAVMAAPSTHLEKYLTLNDRAMGRNSL